MSIHKVGLGECQIKQSFEEVKDFLLRKADFLSTKRVKKICYKACGNVDICNERLKRR